ncbi:hypothetical protein [Dyadobacter sp. OTU695]|uniref:hypothetical protein n=1 Tax=Dyadobacter sp. OTU695 TaxID=3043860 RepID=UPI00313C9B6F
MPAKPVLLSRGQIDAHAWDKHIHHSPQCVIYALSWYLDIVCTQWEALVWPSAADFSIVMPLPVRRKCGVRVLYQPLFCQYLGIFSRHGISTEQCEAFLKALSGRYTYISSYSFNPQNHSILQSVRRLLNGFQWETNQLHWLDLQQPYQELYRRYSKDRKLNLKAGLIMRWEIIGSDDLGPLITLFAENHAPQIGRIKTGAYQTLGRLGRKCIETGRGSLTYARSGSHVRAGMMLARYGGRTIYLFNAADHVGRKGNARAVMLDAYFRENAGLLSVFDFESPSKASIARYYAGFGAVAVLFYCIRRNALPFPLRQIQYLRKWLLVRTRRYLFSGLCRILNPFPKNRF